MARTQFPSPSTGYQGTSRREPPPVESFSDYDEIGSSGAKVSAGFVHDEFLTRLIDRRGRRVYREMRDNDDIIGAVFFMIEGLIRAVEWRVEQPEVDDEYTNEDVSEVNTASTRSVRTPEEAEIFLRGVLFEDMSHTWQDWMMMISTELVFGWQWTEICFKRRLGPSTVKNKGSKFNDGMIGIQKLADRSQETLWKWDEQNGDIYGMWQQPPNGGPILWVPAEKSVHFTTSPNKGNPEGRSMIRNAYVSWYRKKYIQNSEAIGIERELQGLPVIYAPDSVVNGTSAAAGIARRGYEDLGRDIKLNEQASVLLASDPWMDGDGKPTSIRKVSLELLSSQGSRNIDTNAVINRYDQAIARTVLAQFLTMGISSSKGGFAQSRNETDLFFRSWEGIFGDIAATINRELVTKIWERNGLDPAVMPVVTHGKLNPVDISALGDYLKSLAGVGVQVTDKDTMDYLRAAGSLPQTPEDEGEDNIGDLRVDNDTQEEEV